MNELPKLHFGSTEEVLNFAIAKEIEANQFYLEWAQKVRSKAVREVLIEFAGEELNHKELLTGVKAGAAFSKDAENIIDLQISDYFTSAVPKAVMTYQDALRVAIQREIGAVELYNFLGKQVSDSELKTVFGKLEQEESLHKLRLEKIYDNDFMKEN